MDFFAMNDSKQAQGMLCRALPLLLALIVSGCAVTGQDPVIAPDVETTEVEPSPAPEVTPPVKPDVPAVTKPRLFAPRTI
jgi:hypothetical protein